MSLKGNNPRRITNLLAVNAQVFDDSTSTVTSDSIRCVPFHDFLLLIKLVVTASPTDIIFEVEFSNDDVTFYKYMNGPFGDLRYEDTAGNKNEAISGRCIGKYIRVTAIATGTTAQNKFTATVNLQIAK